MSAAIDIDALVLGFQPVPDSEVRRLPPIKIEPPRTSTAPSPSSSAASAPRATDRPLLFDVMKMLRGDCDLTPAERLTLVVLAGFGDGCWPSIPTIAKGTGFGRSTIFRQLASLEAKAWIARVTMRGKSNKYAIAVEKVRAAADCYLHTASTGPHPSRVDTRPAPGPVPMRDATRPAVTPPPVSERDPKISSEELTESARFSGRRGRSKAPHGKPGNDHA